MRARTISYFFSIVAIAVIFFSIEFITEKYFYPNDEVVDILAADHRRAFVRAGASGSLTA